MGYFTVQCEIPFFLQTKTRGLMIILKSLEEAKRKYGENELVCIVNIKQILAYVKNQVQPVYVDEGYKGKLVCYFTKESTKEVFEKWKNYEL